MSDSFCSLVIVSLSSSYSLVSIVSSSASSSSVGGGWIPRDGVGGVGFTQGGVEIVSDVTVDEVVGVEAGLWKRTRDFNVI